jgi:hypothetical protein
MADEKKPDAPAPLELVAVARGFAMGRMVEPGTTFLFSLVDRDGNPRKLPKWAKPASEIKPAPKPVLSVDTKPKDAQAAVKKKAGQFAGTELA